MSQPSPRTLTRTTLTRAAVGLALVAPLALAGAPTASAATTTEMATQVITLVNAQRTKAGCSAFRVSTALNTAARLHSADMAKYDYFSHPPATAARRGSGSARRSTTTAPPRTSRPARPAPSRSSPRG